MKLLALTVIFAIALVGCSSSGEIKPGQLSLRAIETRPIDAPYDIAFRAATHALFALGLSVSHTEKGAGIISAKRHEKNIAAKIGWAVLIGVFSMLIDTDTKIDLTMFLAPAGEKQTRLRIGVMKDGEVVTDQQIIDNIWVVTQREALVEQGEQVPPEIEKKVKGIFSPEADKEAPSTESATR